MKINMEGPPPFNHSRDTFGKKFVKLYTAYIIPFLYTFLAFINAKGNQLIRQQQQEQERHYQAYVQNKDKSSASRKYNRNLPAAKRTQHETLDLDHKHTNTLSNLKPWTYETRT